MTKRYLFLFFLLTVTSAYAQGIHDNQALFKQSVRQECFERFGSEEPGCFEPLETWLKRFDLLQGCQINYAKMCQRVGTSIERVNNLLPGTDTVGFCDLGVTQYVVPQNVPFQDYDADKYMTLTAALLAHEQAGAATMNHYIASIEWLYYVETFHRALLGLPAALPPKRPTFIEVN